MEPDDAWQDNVVNATPPKPKDEGAWRRLRWVAVGSRHRAFLDGALVLSVSHESIRHAGHLDVRVRSAAPSATVELAELAVFEPG